MPENNAQVADVFSGTTALLLVLCAACFCCACSRGARPTLEDPDSVDVIVELPGGKFTLVDALGAARSALREGVLSKTQKAGSISGIISSHSDYCELLESAEGQGNRGHRPQKHNGKRRCAVFVGLTALTLALEFAIFFLPDSLRPYAETHQFDTVLRYRHRCNTALDHETRANEYLQLFDLSSGKRVEDPEWGVTQGDDAFEVVRIELHGNSSAAVTELYHFAMPLYLAVPPYLLRAISLNTFTLRLARVRVLVDDGCRRSSHSSRSTPSCSPACLTDRRDLWAHTIEAMDYLLDIHRVRPVCPQHLLFL
jgi:hypothetical protein